MLKAIGADLTGSKDSIDHRELQMLIHNVFYVSRVSHSVLLASLLYLLRFRFLATQRHDLIQKSRLFEVKNWIFALFVSALTLSSKFHEDSTTHNVKWSENSGLQVSCINTVEAILLNIINYRLEICKSTFNDWVCFVFCPSNLKCYRRGHTSIEENEGRQMDEADQLAGLLIEFSRGREHQNRRRHLKI